MARDPITSRPLTESASRATPQDEALPPARPPLNELSLSPLMLSAYYLLVLLAPFPQTQAAAPALRQALLISAILLLLGLFGLQRWRVFPAPLTTAFRHLIVAISLVVGQGCLYLERDATQLLHIVMALLFTKLILAGTRWLPLLLAGNAVLGLGIGLLVLPPQQQWPFSLMLLGFSSIIGILVWQGLCFQPLLPFIESQESDLETEIAHGNATTLVAQQVLTTLAHTTYNLAGGYTDLTDMLNLALRQLQKVIRFETAVVFLATADTLRARAWLGRPSTVPATLSLSLESDEPAVKVFHTQQLQYYDDLRQYAGNAALPGRSWMGIPLTSDGKKFGVLALTCRQPRMFSQTDARWAKAIANYITVALRNAHLNEWAQRGVERLSFLLEAASTLSATLNSQEVLQQLLNLTLRHFKPAAVSIAVVNSDGSLTFQAASGQVADKMIGLHLPPGKGIVGWVAEHGEPAWVPDTYADPRFHVQTDERTGFRTEALYAMPVIHQGRTLAVIEMVNPAQDMELTETREIMTALADLAASAIQNAVLFEQVYTAEARYQQLFELNMDPVVILDEQGQLLDLNQKAQVLLGLSKTTGPKSCLSVLGLTPEFFTQAKETLQRDDLVVWDYTFQDAQGKTHSLKAHLSPLPQYGPKPSYQWLAHDITEQVALENLRERLSHMIIHDLNGPLNSIMNSMELIRTAWQQKDLTMPIEQLLSISLRSAQRMERLISTILDTGRLRQGERPLSITAIDVQKLIQEAAEISQPMLTHRHQTLSVNLPATLPTMYGDLDLLRRVLINLLNNAIKFTPNQGHIEIQLTLNETDFRFSVRDNGPGIPLHEQAQIFDLYARSESVRQIQGAGIGLAFCKLAVEAHGGRIWVESEPGKGSTFTFSIPRTLPAENN